MLSIWLILMDISVRIVCKFNLYKSNMDKEDNLKLIQYVLKPIATTFFEAILIFSNIIYAMGYIAEKMTFLNDYIMIVIIYLLGFTAIIIMPIIFIVRIIKGIKTVKELYNKYGKKLNTEV